MNYGAPKLFFFSLTVEELSKSALKNSLKDKEYGTRKWNAKSHCKMCAYMYRSWLLTIDNSEACDMFALRSAINNASCKLPQEHQNVKLNAVQAHGMHMTWHGGVTTINPMKRDTIPIAMPCLLAEDVQHMCSNHAMEVKHSFTLIIRLFHFYMVGIKWRAALSTHFARIRGRWLNSLVSKAQPSFFLSFFFSFLFSKKGVHDCKN